MGLSELKSILDLEAWDRLSLSVCEEMARTLATFLPPSFRFKQINTYKSGAQSHQIALFEWDRRYFQENFLWEERKDVNEDERLWEMDRSEILQLGYPYPDAGLFALIPGGKALLGCDTSVASSVFPQDLVNEWQQFAGCLSGEGLPGDHPYTYETLFNYLAHSTSFNKEITPYDVLALYLNHTLLPLREVTIKPFLLEVVAQEVEQGFLLHSQIASDLAQQGFRLPDADEWEYACAAGARTLFHWGNTISTGIYCREIPFTPNAFGLYIANDCYKWEYCADPTIMKGGDGGYAACGGSGRLAEFLPLASAYIFKPNQEEKQRGMWGVHVRRAYSLF